MNQIGPANEMQEAVLALGAASSPDQVRELVWRHPVARTPFFDMQFRRLENHEYPEVRDRARRVREWLDAVRPRPDPAPRAWQVNWLRAPVVVHIPAEVWELLGAELATFRRAFERFQRDPVRPIELVDRGRRLLDRLPPGAHRDLRAGHLLDMGDACRRAAHGDRQEYFRAARVCYEEALELGGPVADPFLIITARHYLGLIAKGMETGDLSEALRTARGHFDAALALTRPEENPYWYAHLHIDLGTVDDSEQRDVPFHTVRAVEHFREALRYLGPENDAEGYAGTCLNLANALQGEQGPGLRGRLEEAIRLYRVALGSVPAVTREPSVRVRTLINLSRALVEVCLTSGVDRWAEAVRCLRDAAAAADRVTDPRSYYDTLVALAHVLMEDPTGDRAGTLAEAERLLREAHGFFTAATYPDRHAGLWNALGEVYRRHPTGRRDRLECAADCFRRAVEHWLATG